jgi:hypothetical protein
LKERIIKNDRHICQGPECHTYKTQSRIRGPKGSKVLRTRPARYDMTTHSWGYIWERYFCDERCMQNWLAKHLTQLMTVVGINTKPNETPIVVEKETKEGWRGTYTDTTIKLLNSNAVEDIVVNN